jgi:hypothetical protein
MMKSLFEELAWVGFAVALVVLGPRVLLALFIWLGFLGAL